MKNIGRIDRVARSGIAVFLVWLGLIYLDGNGGNRTGFVVACSAFIPIYTSITGSSLFYRIFKIHSLNENELIKYGHPYKRDKNDPEPPIFS